MKLHYLLVILLATLVWVGGCGKGPETKKDETTQPASDPIKKPAVQPNEKTPNTIMAPVDASVACEVAPAEAEPNDDPAANMNERNRSESDWRQFRETYISRYLKQPETLVWAIKRSVPKKTAEYLEWGYGSVWPPNEDVPKDLEAALLQARLKDDKEVEEAMNGLSQQGKGGPHYTLGVYIVSWYYCMTGKNDKAKALVDEAALFQSVAERQIAIPKAHLDALQAELAKAPRTVSAPVKTPEVKKPETTTPEVKKPEETTKPEETKKPEETEVKKPEETTKPEETEVKKPEETKKPGEEEGFEDFDKPKDEKKPDEKKPDEKDEFEDPK